MEPKLTRHRLEKQCQANGRRYIFKMPTIIIFKKKFLKEIAVVCTWARFRSSIEIDGQTVHRKMMFDDIEKVSIKC